MVLKILMWTNPILNNPTELVTDFEEVQKVFQDMVETMDAANGIGLAANQVGIPKRFAVMKTSKGPICIVNPTVIKENGKTAISEGCLSVPGFSRTIDRAATITLKYFDMEGVEKVETFYSIEAICAQHEIDHLMGVTIVTKF